MPNRTDCNGVVMDLLDWPAGSYKAIVINRAYQNSEFYIHTIFGQRYVLFQCFWCKKWVGSAAVEGDHVVAQKLGSSSSGSCKRLYAEAQTDAAGDDHWNLVLSCSECNGGSRNKARRMSRSSYQKDRDRQGPKDPSSSGGGTGIVAN